MGKRGNAMHIVISVIRHLLNITGAYRVYEWYLEKQLDPSRIPNHIGIIMDGNRRWSDSLMFDRLDGYAMGADKVYKAVEWCMDMGVRQITLYVLSLENLRRSKDDLDALFRVLEAKLDSLYHDARVYEKGMRIKAIGRIERLPEGIRSRIARLEEATKDHDRYYITLAVAYGGRGEIVESIKRIAEKVRRGELSPDAIDESVIEEHLYTSDLPKQEPDLIIRTSGEVRLSGFLLWQSAYSELVFLDVLWPEFRRIDLLRAIRMYQSRKRRYGL
ncbi:MAG: polyprenyl diphosphate synthase [Candidatus Nitrosocaldus sp.]|nr:polyprenyl diphosphate synthase [Candidatus Nitrosocaldus sp.]MDW8275297.1 polyprenyl diphosphate synthase [Candidatus Nitrosocaldus sp.]